MLRGITLKIFVGAGFEISLTLRSCVFPWRPLHTQTEKTSLYVLTHYAGSFQLLLLAPQES